MSFWPDQLLFSGARELKDKLTLWVLPSSTTDLSGMMGLASSDCRFESGRRDEINSIAPESRENPSRLAMVCLKQSNINGYLWQHRRISCHGLGKQIDWWPALAAMLCRGSGQSDLSKGAFPCPYWRVIILFSNLRCLTPSFLCPCAGLAPVTPYFSCTGVHKTGCSSPHVVSLRISRQEG